MKKLARALFVTALFLTPSLALAINPAGSSSTYFNAALSNTVVAVKTSAGTLEGASFVNKGAADAYVQVFDLATGSVTLGTTTPKLSFWVPAGGAWEEKFTGEVRIGFGTAISMAAATTATGSSAPGTAIVVNAEYK